MTGNGALLAGRKSRTTLANFTDRQNAKKHAVLTDWREKFHDPSLGSFASEFGGDIGVYPNIPSQADVPACVAAPVALKLNIQAPQRRE